VSRTALELLRLLAQDAPAEQLVRQAAELSEHDRGSGAEARDLALRVRSAIESHRRREAGLAALVETARDLASLPDPGTVLDAIVRRARALLGADVAYLTLHDPARGDTYMRATAGSVSARFQNVRLPLGAGLGGLVAQSRQPHWTSDYPGDGRYRHTTEIDAAVDEEGLVAICGTPLLVDGGFVGVLFAAHRSRRPFARDEVALLGSLAALAAVSLVQTRQLAETAQALDALRAAHAGIQQAAAAHDRFAGVVLEGGDVGDLAAALGELLGCWVVVLDADGRRSAEYGAAPPAPAAGIDPLQRGPAVSASVRSGRLAGEGDVWAVSVAAAGQHLGALVVGGITGLDPGQGRMLERAAVVTALVLLFRLRAAEADQRVRTDLLAELLAGAPPGGAAVADRARLLGVALDVPHVVAVCRCPARVRRGVAMAASAAVGEAGLAAAHGDAVVALLPGDDPSTAAADLARRLRGPDGAVTVGAAGPVRPAEGLAAARDEAARCADALLALGRSGAGAAAADLGFAGLLLGDRPDVAGYVDRVLGPVLDRDGRRGSNLVATLEAYLAAGESPRKAATALHVHPNTVVQRLDRVTTLLGAGWQEPDRLLEVRLALHLHRLVAA
jgi:sugar diacid utilization regulator/type II secretory pathway pseudopilin PulG